MEVLQQRWTAALLSPPAELHLTPLVIWQENDLGNDSEHAQGDDPKSKHGNHFFPPLTEHRSGKKLKAGTPLCFSLADSSISKVSQGELLCQVMPFASPGTYKRGCSKYQ